MTLLKTKADTMIYSRSRHLPWAGVALALSLWVIPSQAQTRYALSDSGSTFTYAMEHPMHSWTATSHQASGQV